MPTLHNVPRCYRFADLRLDTGQRQVWRNDVPLSLPKLSFDTLLALVVHAPNVVSHDGLAKLVWGAARVVTSENITQRVMVLRRCLGDSSASPRYIKGIRGYGYRLIPQVTLISRPNGSHHANLFNLPRPADGARRSVAVLPFVRATTDPREVDFARGLHEEVTQCLGRLMTVRVLEEASAQTDADGPASMTRTAAPFVVELIVKGHVGVWGTRVQAVVQLVDPFNCSLVWSRSYDRDIADALSLQTDIARDLVRALDRRFHTHGDPVRLKARELADAR